MGLSGNTEGLHHMNWTLGGPGGGIPSLVEAPLDSDSALPELDLWWTRWRQSIAAAEAPLELDFAAAP